MGVSWGNMSALDVEFIVHWGSPAPRRAHWKVVRGSAYPELKARPDRRVVTSVRLVLGECHCLVYCITRR
jgi:hypothetical protein